MSVVIMCVWCLFAMCMCGGAVMHVASSGTWIYFSLFACVCVCYREWLLSFYGKNIQKFGTKCAHACILDDGVWKCHVDTLFCSIAYPAFVTFNLSFHWLLLIFIWLVDSSYRDHVGFSVDWNTTQVDMKLSMVSPSRNQQKRAI